MKTATPPAISPNPPRSHYWRDALIWLGVMTTLAGLMLLLSALNPV